MKVLSAIRGVARRLLRGERPVVLMYHRVAAPAVDPWGLAVRPELFRDQLAMLKRRRHLMAMDAFINALADGSLPQNAVAITFDDGYRDNLTNAVPLLDEAAAPATIFLTAGAIGRNAPFWWDELARMILLQRKPIRYDLGGRAVRAKQEIDAMAGDEPFDSTWRARLEPRTARQAAYKQLWQLLQRAQPAEREAAMDQLRHMAPPVPAASEELPMTVEEVAQVIKSPHISIGAHGMTHQPLSTLAASDRRVEIEESRAICGELARHAVDGFAFPHGDRDADTIAMVKAAGFAWACSTRHASVDARRSDHFDLPVSRCRTSPVLRSSAHLRLLLHEPTARLRGHDILECRSISQRSNRERARPGLHRFRAHHGRRWFERRLNWHCARICGTASRSVSLS